MTGYENNDSGIQGLQNLGNTCNFNAVLQALAASIQFCRHIDQLCCGQLRNGLNKGAPFAHMPVANGSLHEGNSVQVADCQDVVERRGHYSRRLPSWLLFALRLSVWCQHAVSNLVTGALLRSLLRDRTMMMYSKECREQEDSELDMVTWGRACAQGQLSQQLHKVLTEIRPSDNQQADARRSIKGWGSKLQNAVDAGKLLHLLRSRVDGHHIWAGGEHDAAEVWELLCEALHEELKWNEVLQHSPGRGLKELHFLGPSTYISGSPCSHPTSSPEHERDDKQEKPLHVQAVSHHPSTSGSSKQSSSKVASCSEEVQKNRNLIWGLYRHLHPLSFLSQGAGCNNFENRHVFKESSMTKVALENTLKLPAGSVEDKKIYPERMTNLLEHGSSSSNSSSKIRVPNRLVCCQELRCCRCGSWSTRQLSGSWFLLLPLPWKGGPDCTSAYVLPGVRLQDLFHQWAKGDQVTGIRCNKCNIQRAAASLRRSQECSIRHSANNEERTGEDGCESGDVCMQRAVARSTLACLAASTPSLPFPELELEPLLITAGLSGRDILRSCSGWKGSRLCGNPDVLSLQIPRTQWSPSGQLLKVHGHVSFPLILTREDCQVLKGGTQALSTKQGLYSGLFVQRNKVQLMHSCITIQREAEKLKAASITLESSAEERSYQLVAVVVHSGEGATTGHYFTYCKGRTTTHASENKDINLLTAAEPAAEEKNFLTPAVSNGSSMTPAVSNGSSMTWFCASDKYVRAVTVEEVLASEAFILLYEALN